ncbi:hypothetical protein V1506DRAFT_533391, partial [Lipomyces tetrasporus]
SAGNIVGPLLFNKKDAPTYHPGLRACLGIFIALVAVVLIELANLVFLNKLQERKRVKNGKQAKMVDPSMQEHYHPLEEENVEAQNRLGDNAARMMNSYIFTAYGIKYCITAITYHNCDSC